ncbi:MAG: ATP-binding protein [Proteobacteria bacterium]|nr:ATP-binding protein [Pseudomonadota bacterium]
MQLEFRRRHLSITAFPSVDLPQLAIIVGLNGSGKSHLLEAIKNGSIRNSVFEIPFNQPFDHNSSPIKLLAQGGQPLSFGDAYVSPGAANHPMQTDPAAAFEQYRTQSLGPFRVELRDICGGVLDEKFPTYELWRGGADNVVEQLGLADRADEIRDVFQRAETQLMQPRAYQRHPNPAASEATVFAAAQDISTTLGIPILRIEPEHMKLFARWGITDQFSVNLPMIFGSYRDARLKNWMLQKADTVNGTSFSLSDEEFFGKFGPPPWELLNETLRLFDLPYEVTQPPDFENGRVTVSLRKINTKEVIEFSNLSSGERVLSQFAISTFQYNERFLTVQRPKVLLLDEMDAPLHPEMVSRWLTAIKHGLVEEQGMHCIITTHSPTTVALAPEEALFEMRDARSGLTKISKQNALNRLTFGVPTLSVDYTGRRQVFAESDTDAAIYEGVYALIKSHIRCERELNFLSTGLRDKDNGEINAGCTIVKQTVQRLAELGNSSIFGIVDWDGEAISTDRIKVVAGGERNGIENVMLDPLLVALLLMKERRLPEELKDISRFAGAPSLRPHELQRLIDAIQLVVFPDATDRVEVSYLCGAKGNVFREYLEADDHALEAALAEKFPALNKWKKRGRGELVKAVIEHVLSEHMHFCPAALPAVFEAIANAPTHSDTGRG